MIFFQVNDSYLDISRARLCTETIVERFNKRQFNVTESWDSCKTAVAVLKERRIEHERKMEESTRVNKFIILFHYRALKYFKILLLCM